MTRFVLAMTGIALFGVGYAEAQETKPDTTAKPAPGLPEPAPSPEIKPAEKPADEKKPEEKRPEEKKPDELAPKDKVETKDYSSTVGLAAYFGFQVPLSTYVNNIKLAADSPTTYTLDELSNKIGFAMSLMLKLGSWDFAYNWIIAPLDQLTFSPSPVTKGGTQHTSPKDMSAQDSYQFHSFTAGYRIYLTSGPIRPYLSPHFGIAFVNPGAGASTFLIGAEFGAGLGVDIHLTKGVALGLVLRYRFFITRNPNEQEAQTAFLGGVLTGGAPPTTSDVFSSFLESGSFLTIMGGLSFQL